MAGIGRASAFSLARDGADLTFLCRNLEKGEALAGEIVAVGGTKLTVIEIEMSSLDSICGAAESVRRLAKLIDVFLNNAGVINAHRRVTVDEYEETLAVNHFAPFLLTGLLTITRRA